MLRVVPNDIESPYKIVPDIYLIFFADTALSRTFFYKVVSVFVCLS